MVQIVLDQPFFILKFPFLELFDIIVIDSCFPSFIHLTPMRPKLSDWSLNACQSIFG